MTALEMKIKFIDRIADGDWSLQEFPGKYAAPSMLWLLIWMFDHWDAEIESFVSQFFHKRRYFSSHPKERSTIYLLGKTTNL